MSVMIFHNPRCSNSRNALAMLKASGEAPTVIEYLKVPLDRGALLALFERMGVSPRSVLRTQEAAYAECGLDDLSLSDEAIVEAMIAHPILIQRPIVSTPKGARLCRPPETVLDLLENPVSEFTKENGARVVYPPED